MLTINFFVAMRKMLTHLTSHSAVPSTSLFVSIDKAPFQVFQSADNGGINLHRAHNFGRIGSAVKIDSISSFTRGLKEFATCGERAATPIPKS